jgi:hypothetical protein
VTLSGLSAEVRRTSAIGWLGRGHKRAGGSRSALIAKLTFDEARGSKVPQSDVLTRTRCGPQIARRTSTRLASSAIAFHGRLRSGGGFCSFTGHDTRADPLNFAQHGERMHIWDHGFSSDLAFRQKARRVASRRAPSASLTFRIMKSNRRGGGAPPPRAGVTSRRAARAVRSMRGSSGWYVVVQCTAGTVGFAGEQFKRGRVKSGSGACESMPPGTEGHAAGAGSGYTGWGVIKKASRHAASRHETRRRNTR